MYVTSPVKQRHEAVSSGISGKPSNPCYGKNDDDNNDDDPANFLTTSFSPADLPLN